MRTATVIVALSLSAVPLAAASAVPPARKAASTKEVLTFVANDFPAALARAKARGVPLFVETWAPW